MTTERDRMAYMLAETVLGMRDDQARTARGPQPEMSRAGVEVTMSLESMTRGMIEHIWLNAGAIATAAETAVREATSKVSLEQVVRDAVRAEVERVRRDVADQVRKRLEDHFTSILADEIESSGVRGELRALAWSVLQPGLDRARAAVRAPSEQPAMGDGEFVEVPVTRRARLALVGRLIAGRSPLLARWGQTEPVALTAGDLVVVRCDAGAPFRPGLGLVVPGDVVDLSGIVSAADGDLLYRVEPEAPR